MANTIAIDNIRTGIEVMYISNTILLWECIIRRIEIVDLECPYIQLSNKNEFGMINDLGEVVTVGNCGNGGYFNDTEGICTCTVVGREYKTCTLLICLTYFNQLLKR